MSKREKYTLYSADSEGPKVCAFFNSTAGCKNGANCKFAHGTSNASRTSIPQTSKRPIQEDNAQQVLPSSSFKKQKSAADDEGTRRNHSATASAPLAQPSAQRTDKHANHPRHSLESAPRVSVPNMPPGFPAMTPSIVVPHATTTSYNPVVQHQQHQQQQQQQQQQVQQAVHKDDNDDDDESDDDDEEEDTAFLYSAVNHAIKETAKPSPKKTPSNPVIAATPRVLPMAPMAPMALMAPVVMLPPTMLAPVSTSFVPNEMVTKLLATSGTTHATLGPTISKHKPKVSSTVLPSAPSTAAASADFGYSYDDMIELVVRTQKHDKFAFEYAMQIDSTWVNAKPYGDWCSSMPRVIAIDCEMCVTEDPVTGAKDPLTLIRFSAVKGFGTSDVLLDTLVLPSLPIVDMKENIHGISEDRIRSATYTLRYVQAFMLNLVSDRTIIIGHSVHHDLKTLRFAHNLVIDTSYLFSLANENGAASIRDVSEQLLGHKLPDTHDSVLDAQASFKAAIFVTKNGNPPEVVRSSSKLNSLFLHKIPKACSLDSLQQMIIEHTHILPTQVAPIEMASNGEFGSTMIQFASMKHADLAFDSISGPVRPDSTKKAQKRVYLKGGGYLLIRKN